MFKFNLDKVHFVETVLSVVCVQNQRFVGVEGKVVVEFQKEKWRNTSQPTDVSSGSSARRGASGNYSSLSLSLSLSPLRLLTAAPRRLIVPLPSPRPALGEHPCTRVVALHSGSLPSRPVPSCPRFKIVNINKVTACFLF